jgi:hypothetical protein
MKTLSLKLEEEILEETEAIIKNKNIPRNRYIKLCDFTTTTTNGKHCQINLKLHRSFPKKALWKYSKSLINSDETQ